jgi:hypothetical protein
MPFESPYSSAQRLASRLPLLEKLVESKTVHTAVLMRLLETIEQDLAAVSDKELEKLRDATQERAQWLKNRQAVEAQVAKLRAGLTAPAGALTSRPEWKKVAQAWQVVPPLANGLSTKDQREYAEGVLKEATAGIEKLAADGALLPSEKSLLLAECRRMRAAMYRFLDPDKRERFIPAEDSLKRLLAELPLLDELAQPSKCRPEVVDKLLPAVKDDLKVLADGDKLSALEGPLADRARQLGKLGQDTVERIERLLGKQPPPGPVIPDQLPRVILQPIGPGCYLPVMGAQLPSPGPESLRKRQTLLARLVEDGTIPPAVAQRLRGPHSGPGADGS